MATILIVDEYSTVTDEAWENLAQPQREELMRQVGQTLDKAFRRELEKPLSESEQNTNCLTLDKLRRALRCIRDADEANRAAAMMADVNLNDYDMPELIEPVEPEVTFAASYSTRNNGHPSSPAKHKRKR